MDSQPMNQGPQGGVPGMQTPPIVQPPKPKKEGTTGATLAIIVILLLIVAGGAYYFMNVGTLVPQSAEEAMMEESAMESEMAADESVAALGAQGTSDELADIEADVNATDLSGLDEASAGFETELQAQ